MAQAKYNIKGTRGQDLAAARKELKQFRHDVAQLKKKGILDKKIYDARSVTPSKYLKSQIKKYATVLSGEAVPVKVSKKTKNYYVEKGYQTKGDRVIVPIQKNEKAYSVKGDIRVRAQGKNGSITKIDLALDRNDITKWAEELKRVGVRLKKDEVLTFQFFGNNSHAAFENLHRKTAWQAMAEYIQNYPAFEYVENNDPDKQQDFIDNVVIFKIQRDSNGTINRPQTNYLAIERSEEMRRRDSERNRQRYENKLNRMSVKEEARFHEEKKLRERERRAAMKLSDPDTITKYREAAKLRAKKSREKRNEKGKA